MVKPITPDEVVTVKKAMLPDDVIEAWNEVIAEHWKNDGSYFSQKEIVKRLVEKLNISSTEVFDKSYLDVEDIYEECGWKVDYDKPAYNESYPATFEFTKPKKR
jgi:hypothetical protein